MIDNVLDVIKEEVDSFMKLKMKDTREQYIQLVPVIDQEGKPSVSENTICMSLVKIEDDRINMSNGTNIEYTANGVQHFNPPVKLNLFVLFSASISDGQEKNYKEALKRIARVIEFFQSKNVFNAANTPMLDHSVGKITAELFNMNMEEQNNLWSMLGSIYRPSVLYKFRALLIQEKHALPGGGPVLKKDLELGVKK
ncbi:MAG: DUF4255 domain-containing protein [bacterium]|nr:DUF4255 domain-containing protein [bacterium]